MLQNALNLIRGLGDYATSKSQQYFLPKIGNIIGKGIDIAQKLPIPGNIYQRKANDIFDYIHNKVNTANKIQDKMGGDNYIERIGRSFIIPKKSNASYGLGSYGPKELSPAFIGDRQEREENYERLARSRKSILDEPRDSIFKERKKFETIREYEPKLKPSNMRPKGTISVVQDYVDEMPLGIGENKSRGRKSRRKKRAQKNNIYKVVI